MPLDKRDDRSFMDGVHVKISEKYKRRPVIRIPVSCQNCATGPAFLEKYDFRLEHTALEKMDQWKKFKIEQRIAREDKIKKFNESQEQEVKKCNVDNDAKAKSIDESNVTNSLESHILTPVNATQSEKKHSQPIPSNFNVSDFETDNSSPFDNMELKTINDMEILASVLSTTSDNYATEVEKTPSSSSINNNFIPNAERAAWNNWNGYHNVYSSPSYFEYPSHYPSTYHNTGYNYQSPNSHVPWQGGGNTYVPSSSSQPVKENYLKYSVSDSRGSAHLAGLQSPKTNSKSVPDLVLELENELKEKKLWDEHRRKTQTPPPRTAVTTSSGLEDWKPWPEIESPRHLGPDAVETLDVSLQALAKNISEMGFPIERVVRTIRKFNRDDKKVIEFLLQVQRFEEKKFKSDIIEKALHANNYDEAETLKHLEATNVLLDLGFDPIKIQSVLLDCKNDRDAALDRLIS